MPKENTTYKANATANKYTVSFNENGGGTPSSTSIEVTYNSTYGTLPTISRTGYTFDGWFTAASGGTQIIADTKEVMLMALEDIASNRAREGARLYEFFNETIKTVKDIVKIIAERSPETVAEYRRKLTARKHIVANRDLTSDKVLTYAVINALIMATEDDDILHQREAVCLVLVVGDTIGRGEDNLVVVALRL